jgi:SOS response regulatory protein OraA/RecX
MAGTPQRRAGPVPDNADLRDAALAYLARYAATESALRRVLERRVERWARAAAGAVDTEVIASQVSAAREALRDVVSRLVAAGAVNDAAYAEARARSLVRAGRSRRAVTAHLLAKGVDPDMAHTARLRQPWCSHGGGESDRSALAIRPMRLGVGASSPCWHAPASRSRWPARRSPWTRIMPRSW